MKQTHEALLINDEKSLPQLTYKDSIKEVLSLATSPIIGSFFHPMYLIVNASYLGNYGGLAQLAGAGLGSLTLSICVLSI